MALAGAATLLAACGSTTGKGGGAAGNSTLDTTDRQGVGTTLVDSAGKTVYFADQEAGGELKCVKDCLEFWFPVLADGGKAPTVNGVRDLGVLHRSDDGKEQLTYQGKPLYTFQLDKSAGDIKGNAFEDDFGGTHFVWHAATVGDHAPAPTNGGGGGY